MTKYLIGADNINGKEHAYINRMLKFLKDNGHQATSLGVGPNVVQRKGQTSGSKGCVGVQIVGGNGGGTPSDAMLGIKQGYYHYNYWITIGSYEFTHNSLLKTSAMDKKWTHSYETDIHSMDKYYVGLSPNSWNTKYSKYAKIIYNDSFDEAMKIMIGGETKKDDKGNSSGGSYLDAIKELVSVYDGDVEITNINEELHINQIPKPSPTVYIREGYNIVSGSVNVTDYNPLNPNVLEVTYGKHLITMKDPYLIERFGENKVTVPALEYVTKYSNKESSEDKQVESSSQVSTVPITTREKALEFAQRTWSKIRRNNGHTIECQVFGFNDLHVGEWCEVKIPSFNEDCIMYITKANNSKESGSEWLVNLTLNDYPLSFGQPQVTNKEDEETSSEEDMSLELEEEESSE